MFVCQGKVWDCPRIVCLFSTLFQASALQDPKNNKSKIYFASEICQKFSFQFFNRYFSWKSILLGKIQGMVKIDKFFQVLFVNYVFSQMWLESIFVFNFSKQYIHLSHHHLPCSNHAAPTTVSS